MLLQALCGEVTWVTADHAAEAAGQLSVRAGQQVEVVGGLEGGMDGSVLVRLAGPALDSALPDTGYVPASCLKLPPSKTFQLCKEPVLGHGDSADPGRATCNLHNNNDHDDHS